MAEIIDLIRYRDSELGEKKPPSAVRLGHDASATSSSGQREAVQFGVTHTAQHLGVNGLRVTGDYSGYLLARGIGQDRVVIGTRGLHDFEDGFLAARGTASEKNARRAAGIAYGLYGAALLMLPDRCATDAASQNERQRLAAAYSEEHPEISVSNAMDVVIHMAAATWGLLGLNNSISAPLKNNLQMVADAGALLISQEGLPVAQDFQHRLAADYLVAVAGLQAEPKRPLLTLVK